MQCGRLWTLRRRCCSGPVLLLGVAVCLVYQTLMVARSRFRSPSQPVRPDEARGGSNRSEPEEEEERPFDALMLADAVRLISALETLQRERDGSSLQRSERSRAVVLTGQHVSTDTEVQLYQRVLSQTGHDVSLSRYAETSTTLRASHGVSEWRFLVCLSGSEKSCLRRVFPRLQRHQRVNMVPGLVQAFSDAGRGLCRFLSALQLSGTALPMNPSACGSTREPLGVSPDGRRASEPDRPSPSAPPGLVAMVNVYVLVTSATPLTVFLHRSGVVRTGEEADGRTAQLQSFLLQMLGPSASQEAMGHVREVVGQVLEAASLTTRDADSSQRCLLCYQLLTVTLQFSGSLLPVAVKVESDLSFAGLKDPAFDGQITKERILEDTLHFLLPAQGGGGGTTRYGGCRGTYGLCLPEDELLFLVQFQRQMKTPGPFELVFPRAVSEGWPHQQLLPRGSEGGEASRFSTLLALLHGHYRQKNHTSYSSDQTQTWTNQESGPGAHHHHGDGGRCMDPHLRQLYTDPPLSLTPPFSPQVKEYRAEVPFDVVTVRIRPEPISAACRVHLDEHRGPRTSNYPVGLGNSRINILVTDEESPGAEPVAMTIYTLHMYRESRPSLPMFGDHVMCGFLQDCGLVVQPGQPCGLEPFPGPESPGEPQASLRPCTSGGVPGRWVVPCLSCADNRTCDWREVAWQPEGCYHPLLDRPQLQKCMTDRKVMFIGDSTNRGMMYFLMERLNRTLDAWGKAHDTLLYGGLNHGRTRVSYSYYPQFWLERSRMPTFQQALGQLLQRSRPLQNSRQTVLVAGGVQWLNANHLRIIREVLEREGLPDIMVVVKTLGMGFHLPVDGIRSLSLRGVQELYRENSNIVSTAKRYGYEVIDTFSITMGRYKEFLQGRCACHFHEVEKLSSSEVPLHRRVQTVRPASSSRVSRASGLGGTGLSEQAVPLDQDQWAEPNSSSSSYHVRGPVNQVYSEILLSRLCPRGA